MLRLEDEAAGQAHEDGSTDPQSELENPKQQQLAREALMAETAEQQIHLHVQTEALEGGGWTAVERPRGCGPHIFLECMLCILKLLCCQLRRPTNAARLSSTR